MSDKLYLSIAAKIYEEAASSTPEINKSKEMTVDIDDENFTEHKFSLTPSEANYLVPFGDFTAIRGYYFEITTPDTEVILEFNGATETAHSVHMALEFTETTAWIDSIHLTNPSATKTIKGRIILIA